jgi:hypothetical protein
VELGELSELSVKFADNDLSVDEVFIGDFAERFSPLGVEDLLLFIVFHGHGVNSSLHVTLSFSLHTVCWVYQHSIVLI